MAALGPYWGSLADRHGPRLMVGRAMFGGAFVIGAMGLVRSVYGLFGLRVLQGAVTGVQAAITVLVASIVPRQRLGSSVGLLQVATFGGASVGPLLGGIVADRFGFRPAFLVTGALMLLSGVVVFAGVPRTGRPRAGRRRGWGWPPGCAGPPPRRPVLTMLCVLMALSFATTVVSPVLPLYVKELQRGQRRARPRSPGWCWGWAGCSARSAPSGPGGRRTRWGTSRC